MRLGDLIATALASLWQRKFRTALTVLGVVIGTTAVVVMVGQGLGMAKAQMDQITQSSNLRQVVIQGPPMTTDSRQQPARMDDALFQEVKMLPGVVRAWPVYEVSAIAKVQGMEGYVIIEAIPGEALAQQGFEFGDGTNISSGGSQYQLVVGNQFQQMFFNPSTGTAFEPDSGSMVGTTLKLDFEAAAGGGMLGEPNDTETSTTPTKKITSTVTGQLAGGPEHFDSKSILAFADLDQTIKVLKTAFSGKALPNQDATAEGKPKGTFLYSRFVLETETMEQAAELYKLATDMQYQVQADIEWITQMEEQVAQTQAVFGGIGAISLLVAAIGIANTMMMSVYERTREIGVMKVLGAALKDIRRLFLIEAAGIGFIGGLLGVVASLSLGGLINQWMGSALNDGMNMGMNMGMGMPSESAAVAIFPPWLLLSAVGFATLIGTLAGLLPAQRAMKLSALEAIRTQ